MGFYLGLVEFVGVGVFYWRFLKMDFGRLVIDREPNGHPSFWDLPF